MAQQFNLCLPVLRQQKKRFTAKTLMLSLTALLLGGGALSTAWIHYLDQATAALNVNLERQTKELEALRTAIEQRAKAAAPAEQTLLDELKSRRAALAQRDSVLAALSQGLFEPGRGHAARLQLIARSIPVQVWVTHIRADERLLEISGYTLAPDALNDWDILLAASDLLRGQTLSAIKVESAKPGMVALPGGSTLPVTATAQASAPAVVLPPMWSFTLTRSGPPAALPKAGAKS